MPKLSLHLSARLTIRRLQGMVCSYPWPALLFSFLLGLLALAALLAICSFPSSPPRMQYRPVSVTHPEAGVTLVAEAQSNRIVGEPDTTLHLTLIRKPPLSASMVRICATTPRQTETSSTCRPWDLPIDEFRSEMDLPVTLKKTIGPQSVLVSLYADNALRKTKSAPGFAKMMLRVGPLYVDSHPFLDGPVGRAIRRLRAILRDFAVPIAGVLLAAILAFHSARKAHREEVSRRLLDKTQGLTKRFYVQMVSALRRAVSSIEEEKKPGTGGHSASSFYLYTFIALNARLKIEEGGIFFHDLTAENIYSLCTTIVVGKLRLKLGGQIGYEQARDAFLKLSGKHEATAPLILPTLDKYSRYVSSTMPELTLDDEIVQTLDILRTVTEFELDAPLYQFWYRDVKLVDFATKFPSDTDLKQSEFQPEWKKLRAYLRLWTGDKPLKAAYTRSDGTLL